MEKGQAWFFLAPSLSTPLFPLPLLLLPAPVMGRFVSSRARDDRANYRETISYRAAHSNSTRFFLLSKIAVVGKLRNERTVHHPSLPPRFLRVIDLVEILDRFVGTSNVSRLPPFPFSPFPFPLFFFFRLRCLVRLRVRIKRRIHARRIARDVSN